MAPSFTQIFAAERGSLCHYTASRACQPKSESIRHNAVTVFPTPPLSHKTYKGIFCRDVTGTILPDAVHQVLGSDLSWDAPPRNHACFDTICPVFFLERNARNPLKYMGYGFLCLWADNTKAVTRSAAPSFLPSEGIFPHFLLYPLPNDHAVAGYKSAQELTPRT